MSTEKNLVRSLTVDIAAPAELVWSVLIVQMEQVGFPFSKAQLYQLPAIAGLSGAMMRLSHSFLLGIAGGRLVMAASTLLLAVPALRQDGRRISVEFTIMPMHGADGRMDGMAAGNSAIIWSICLAAAALRPNSSRAMALHLSPRYRSRCITGIVEPRS